MFFHDAEQSTIVSYPLLLCTSGQVPTHISSSSTFYIHESLMRILHISRMHACVSASNESFIVAGAPAVALRSAPPAPAPLRVFKCGMKPAVVPPVRL